VWDLRCRFLDDFDRSIDSIGVILEPIKRERESERKKKNAVGVFYSDDGGDDPQCYVSSFKLKLTHDGGNLGLHRARTRDPSSRSPRRGCMGWFYGFLAVGRKDLVVEELVQVEVEEEEEEFDCKASDPGRTSHPVPQDSELASEETPRSMAVRTQVQKHHLHVHSVPKSCI
jgi:hypothetical protein